jgi:K+-transporting ATPase c subunit
MAKSESNPELELAKSEAAAEKAKAEQLQKSLDTVTEFLTKLVKKVPQGKAITQYEQVAKSESADSEKQLSKSEITAILSKKAADPSLSKTDREAINAFYLNQSNVSTISHLLK